jgi:hypothetical protein
MSTLFQLTDQYRALLRLDASEDLPAEVIQDTLEGLTGDLSVKATNVAKFILNVEAMADAVDAAGKAMKVRADRMRERADSIREYLRLNMQAADLTRIEAPEFVLSIRKNPPSVIVDDESLIPDDYKVTPEPPPPPQPRPDKKLIAKAIKDGYTVPGCRSEQGTRLEIKL